MKRMTAFLICVTLIYSTLCNANIIFAAPNTKYVRQIALEGASGTGRTSPFKNLISSESFYYNDGEYEGYLYLDMAQTIEYTWESAKGYNWSSTTLANAWESGLVGISTSSKYGVWQDTPVYYSGTAAKITDLISPVLTFVKSITIKTNQNVKIIATASDDKKLHDTPYNMGKGWGIGNTLTVETNGTYSIMVRDSFNNITTKDVVIDNIDKSPPSFFVSSLGVSEAGKVLVTVLAQDNSMEALNYSFDSEVTWQDNSVFEAEAGKELNISVKDTAGNIASTMFVPSAPGADGGSNKPINIPITIFDNSEIESMVYGLPGVVKNGIYTSYASLTHMPEAIAAHKTTGIALKLEVSSTATDKYLAGAAQLGNKEYPIHWNSFTGETIIPASNATGYIYIDKSNFTSNFKRAKLKVVVGEYMDAGARTKTAEGSSNIYATIDISPPAINASYSRGRGTVTIDTFDSVSEVKDVLYSLDGGAFKKYTSDIAVSSANSYVDIVAVDMVENSATYRLPLTASGSAGDKVDTDIYTYKTKNSIVYIVNGNKSNTDSISLSDFKIG